MHLNLGYGSCKKRGIKNDHPKMNEITLFHPCVSKEILIWFVVLPDSSSLNQLTRSFYWCYQ